MLKIADATDKLPAVAVRAPLILTVPALTESEVPVADLPAAIVRELVEPARRLMAPLAADTLSVSERLPVEAFRDIAPAEAVTPPVVRLPEPAVMETELPLARRMPDKDETFADTAPAPPLRLTDEPAERAPPVTVIAPEVVGLTRMLAPAAVAFNAPLLPSETPRE